MRFLIFCLLVSFCLCDESRYFRSRNGTFIRGNRNPITFSGTLQYDQGSSYINVYLYGMDYTTMTPVYLALMYGDKLATDDNVHLDCWSVRHGLETFQDLSGSSYLTLYSDGCELSAACYTKTGDLWIFKSSNVETKKQYYSPKEAGFRAKFLVDQPKLKYGPQDVITFAAFDIPYYCSRCNYFLYSWYPVAPGPEPGAIMVGKYGDHCAILDNEGTKFTHSNPVAGKVTYDSIAVARRYFPSGIFYKKYPD